jgi:hypothetical protein
MNDPVCTPSMRFARAAVGALRRHLPRVTAMIVTLGLFLAAAASSASAIDPRRDPEIDPPEVTPPDFSAPDNGFSWRVDGRFGSKVANPDDAQEPALINYHYCAPERPNVNCRGDVGLNRYTYDPAYVHPEALHASFAGCPTEAEDSAPPGQTSYRYTWRIVDTSTHAVRATYGPSASCGFEHDFEIDASGAGTPNTGVRLTITDPHAADANAPILGSPYEQPVVVRDYLIVSIGDSYGSGEGNPDVPQKFATGPFDIPLPIVTRNAVWEDARCHRSATAGPAQAAMRLEMADPHSSVTFLSFACSGANVKQHAFDKANPLDPYSLNGVVDNGVGVLEPYAGTVPPAGAPMLDDQITEVKNGVGDRRVDALVMSGGGNDIGFANIATLCVVVVNCDGRSVTASDAARAAGATTQTLDARVHDDLAALTGIYDQLADRLQNEPQLNVSKLYLTEYPDSTRGDAGAPCSAILDDVIPVGTAIVAGVLVAVVVSVLSVAYPWLGPAVIAAAVAGGVLPPFGLFGNEVAWAGNSVLPLGGSDADHGLDHVIADAVQKHAHDRVPWELVGGITEDFQGTGALSSGTGHGYCASNSWIRSAADASAMQGPYNFAVRNDTRGTLHPNAAGHANYAAHIYDHLKSLLPPTSGPAAQPPQFFMSDKNSTANTTTDPEGMTAVTSVVGSNGWLVGCTPLGTNCQQTSPRAVEQIVARVGSTTTVRGAGLTINGASADCATGTGLPTGVTCQQALLAGGRLFKWSFQFAADGIYRLSTTVTAQDNAVGSAGREVKVDLHDPLGATANPQSSSGPINGWHGSPVTVTFDVPDPGNGGSSLQGVGLQGILYQLDGQPDQLVRVASQLPPGVSLASAQIQVTADGIHTLVYRTLDVGGRTSPPVTTTIKIDQTAPSVTCANADALWHAADVAIGCSSADAGSGLADPTDASLSLSTAVAAGAETSNAATTTHDVCDVAGNCATAGPVGGVRVDKKGPAISVSAPSATTYALNQTVASSYGCNDGGSGLASCTGPVPSGQNLDTASNGTKTFSVHAVDAVGKPSDRSVTYQVGYRVCALYDQTKAHKAGSTIPLKLQLCDASGANLSAPAVAVTTTGLTKVDNSASSVVDTATAPASDRDFRYDAGLAGYIYNFKSTGLTTGTWALTFTTTGDGVSHTVLFDVR